MIHFMSDMERNILEKNKLGRAFIYFLLLTKSVRLENDEFWTSECSQKLLEFLGCRW